uniref:NAC domain-containing protein n=1 Tax=Leersia perrieri TaxID=77586 RepID=A0A0D9V9R8_9ORYZ
MATSPALTAAGGGGGGYRTLPIGFRFRPTDEELLLHYLRRKVLSFPLPADVIPVADLARLHPSDLLLPGDGEGERYFFHRPATSCWRKGGGGGRAGGGGGGGGVWRASGKEKLVVAGNKGGAAAAVAVGAKRTLVFFLRHRRTEWAMHEFRLLPAGAGADQTPAAAKEWVVCRIFRRSPPRVRRRDDDDVSVAPSSPSSCVTDGGGDGEEGEEESSGGDGSN